MSERLSEFELKARMDGVLRTLDWSDSAARDAYVALTNETARARHWERCNEDRIHALEAQQAELLRQVKMLADVLSELHAMNERRVTRPLYKFSKAMEDALKQVGRLP